MSKSKAEDLIVDLKLFSRKQGVVANSLSNNPNMNIKLFIKLQTLIFVTTYSRIFSLLLIPTTVYSSEFNSKNQNHHEEKTKARWYQ